MKSWFLSENEREKRKAQALCAQLPPQRELAPFVSGILQELNLSASDPCTEPACEALVALLYEEPFFQLLPDVVEDGLSTRDYLKLQSLYEKKLRLLENAPALVPRYFDSLSSLFGQLIVSAGSSPFPTTIGELHPDLRRVVEHIHNHAAVYKDIFPVLNSRLRENRLNRERTKELRPAETNLPVHEFLYTFLRETPYRAYFSAPVSLPLGDRFSHMHIVGGTGAGKTSLLETLVLSDLETDASLVVVDSQGDLIRKIAGLKRLQNRRVIRISPRDPTLSVNVFDASFMTRSYDDAMREQVVAGVIQTFDYLFASLIGADLTAKQSVFFRYIARLMLMLPETLGRNATIIDMLRLMEDPTPYLPAIRSLPDIQRQFFERDFAGKTFTQTREQIRYRLHAIIENPTLARLFTSQKNGTDLFAEMNAGSIILIDTAKDFLKGSSAHFGQIFISLVLQATLERAALPPSARHPTFLMVDEAAEYFDSNIDDLLVEARKYRLGCVFAHQYLDQCTAGLRASLASNTSIKLASGVSMADARTLAPEMRTTADFILSQPRLKFAAFVRNVTPTAISVPITPGLMDREDTVPISPFPPAPAPDISPARAEEDSDEW